MTAPAGPFRAQLDAAVADLALQVDRDTVLQARAALMAEAQRLRTVLQREAPATVVDDCGRDPVSPQASAGFNRRITEMLEGCRRYCDDLDEAARARSNRAQLRLYGERDLSLVQGRWRVRSVLLVTTTAFLALAAACAPAGGGADGADATTGALPPPPQALPLDGLDPCSLLSEDQLRSLNVGGETFTPADTRRGPICQWAHFPDEPKEGYLIELLREQDVEEFLTLSGRTVPTVIAGYPAVQTDFQGLGLPRPGACTVLVGVSEDQTVQISYSYDGSLTVTSEQSCAKARTAAEMATQTLINLQGGDR